MANANTKRIERQGFSTEPYTRRYPEVRGGICEYCGVVDKNVASEHQYKLCEHFRGMQLACSYCANEKDPNDVIYHSKMNIYDHPTDPNSLVVVCDSYECTRRHQQRFVRSA